MHGSPLFFSEKNFGRNFLVFLSPPPPFYLDSNINVEYIMLFKCLKVDFIQTKQMFDL